MQRMWTVARFPSGIWSTGGSHNDPEYACCEVFQVIAKSRDEAKRKAQSIRSNAIRKQKAAEERSARMMEQETKGQKK